jgi:uncharacterized membrane protein YfcA
LLLATPTEAFDRLLPWLLLLTTLALALGRRIGGAVRRGRRLPEAAVVAVQLLLGLYCGYFGGAVGILMIAFWSFAGGEDFTRLQGARALLVSAGNSAAVALFACSGAVDLRTAALLAPGALAGGWAGAWIGRRLPEPAVRAATLALAAAVTAIFFARAY